MYKSETQINDLYLVSCIYNKIAPLFSIKIKPNNTVHNPGGYILKPPQSKIYHLECRLLNKNNNTHQCS